MSVDLTRDDMLASRSQPTWTLVCIVLGISVMVGILGTMLISSGRTGSLTVTSGDNTFELVLPDAEEQMDLETILAQAIPNPADAALSPETRTFEIRRASTLALLQEGYHLYEFGGNALIDRIRRLDPMTDGNYAGAFVDLVRRGQGPFAGTKFEEIPPPQTVEVLFWDGINEHLVAVCDGSAFRNKWIRLVNEDNNEQQVLYASSVLVRTDCSFSPNAMVQINPDRGNMLFGVTNLPRSLHATASLNPAEPPPIVGIAR